MRHLLLTALAAVGFCAFAMSASAQQLYAAPHDAAWMATNGYVATKVVQPDGRIRTDWECYGNIDPKTKVCTRTTRQTHVSAAPSAVQAPAATICPWGAQYTKPQCDELTRQYTADLAQGKVPTHSASAPQSAAVPSGNCWTKHPMSKAQLVELLQLGVASTNWYANMCLPPEQFVQAFERMVDLDHYSTVRAFAGTIASFKEVDCADDTLKNMVAVTTAGQKIAMAPKCEEDEKLWLTQNDKLVFRNKKGVVAPADAIFRKP